jgi:hypothetical protein
MDDQHAGIGRGQRDVREVGHRIVVEIAVQRGRDRHGGNIRHHQGVAVGCGLGDLRRADGGSFARPVLDHDVLAEPPPEIFADHAADHVGGAAGRVGHYQLDRLGRPLRLCSRGQGERKRRGKQVAAGQHAASILAV